MTTLAPGLASTKPFQQLGPGRRRAFALMRSIFIVVSVARGCDVAAIPLSA